MSKVTVRQAAKLTGKSRETINTATKEGKLSFTLDSSNRKVVEIAELERVYPLVKSFEQINQQSETVKPDRQVSEPDVRTELAVLREKLANSESLRETVFAERERERRQFEAELDTLRSSLEKTIEQNNKALLLITDQSDQTKERAGDWHATARKLEEQIAGQQAALEQRITELQKNAKREAVEEIKDKYWWQVLFLKTRE